MKAFAILALALATTSAARAEVQEQVQAFLPATTIKATFLNDKALLGVRLGGPEVLNVEAGGKC